MGASGSKASRAAGSAARQYPKGPKGPRPPPPSTTTTTAPAPSQTTNAPPQPPPAQDHAAGPTVRPQPRAAPARSEAINLDASDPDFARSLRSLGPVQPNPTLSPSSAFGQRGAGGAGAPDPRKNPAIAVLEARAELQRKADAEQEARAKQGRGFVGKEFLDVFDLRQVVFERDVKGRGEREIERRLGLKEGVVAKLGGEGVLGLAREQGREKGAVDVV